MLQLSQPSPPHAPRVETIGPHFDKLFLPDRWNPIHILKAPDVGPPHCHPYSLLANILIGGYIEDVWVLTEGGGYTRHQNVARKPGTTHHIVAETIHLIKALPNGFSITEAEPEEARRDWFFYLPQGDGSVLRSTGWDGPWQDYHPAGPIEVVDHGNPEPTEVYTRQLRKQREWLVEEELPNNFVIGPGNTWQQATDAMLAGHAIRQPFWYPDASWIVEAETSNILRVKGATKAEWLASKLVVPNGAIATVEQENWVVLPKIHVEQPTI